MVKGKKTTKMSCGEGREVVEKKRISLDSEEERGHFPGFPVKAFISFEVAFLSAKHIFLKSIS